jgi:hypothetical protein
MEDQASDDKKKKRASIIYRPGKKRFFGLIQDESNFELFMANVVIEQLVMLSSINDQLEEINAKTKELPKPRAKAKAKRKTKAKKK